MKKLKVLSYCIECTAAKTDIEVPLVQNNAFSSYVSITTDKEQKTKILRVEVQNQRIDIDTVVIYLYW